MMRIGVPKEIKNHEYRVGVTPGMAKALIDCGHSVCVQTNAAPMLGMTDEHYKAVGCTIARSIGEAYDADMVIKVKEPQAEEFPLMHEGQIIFGFFHLAPDPKQTAALVEQKVVAIAYETVTDRFGRLPLLIPMSEIAGRMSIQAGASSLEMANGGRGVLMGGVPGVAPAKVVVIGGGIVGTEAARMAMGLGADVTVFDTNLARLRELDELFGPRLKTQFSNPGNLEEHICQADLTVGAVLIPGKTAPKLISRELVGRMMPGSVLVDVAVDQGGCAETSRPTTHSDPIYVVDDVVHYCVSNMPGAYARTATLALTHATERYALMLANMGADRALAELAGLRAGLNLYHGLVTNEHVAADLGYEYHRAEEVLESEAIKY